MVRSTSSKASNANEQPEISVTEQVRLYGIYIEEQKAALEDARRLTEKLQGEYNQLRLERDLIQQEAFASTEYYEGDVKQKKELIQDLENKLEEKINENASIRKQWQDDLAATATAAKMEKAELINHIAKIEKELYTLQHFSERKAQLEAKLAEAAQENIQLVEKHQKELAELERKYIEQGINLKKDYDRSLEEIDRKLNAEIEDRVGQRVRNILAENERLGDEIRMHVEITGNLQRDIEQLQAESAGVSRDIDLLKEADNLHLQRSSTQARVIAQSNSKLVRLEQSIGSVVRQYGSERRALEDEHLKSIASFQLEKQTLRRLVLTKTKELRKVRQLAQQVLRERGEVESFLIESLHTVVEEIKRAKKQQAPPILTKSMLRACGEKKQQDGKLLHSPSSQKSSARSAHSDSSTVGSRGTSTVSYPAKPVVKKPTAADKGDVNKGKSLLEGETEQDVIQQMEEVPVRLEPSVDVSQLSWSEKEKVLRYLFTKINSAHQIPNDVVNQAKYPELFETESELDDRLCGSVSDAGRVLV